MDIFFLYSFRISCYTKAEVSHLKFTALLLLLCLLLSGCNSGDTPTTTPHIPPAATTTETTEDATVTAATEAYTTEAAAPVFDPYFYINNMSLEELVGQVFLARCPGENAMPDIETYQFGGLVLFGRDFETETPDSLRNKLEQFQETSHIPMLIAVDEEGGTVTRISSYRQYRDSRFPSPRQLYTNGGFDLLLSTEAEKCLLLRNLGINVNLAPVCDVTTDPNAFMYQRSLGQSAAITGSFVSDMCRLMSAHQIGSVLKHFPGYGNNADTHTGIAVDSRSLAELELCDLIPFRAGIAASCDSVLISHSIVECLDSSAPASLSANVIHYLRQDLDFMGVIMTDDLIMEAVTDQYGTGEAAVLALLAGNDLLCSSEYAAQYDAVLEAVRSGRITRSQLEESVARILRWKYKLGLLAE